MKPLIKVIFFWYEIGVSCPRKNMMVIQTHGRIKYH